MTAKSRGKLQIGVTGLLVLLTALAGVAAQVYLQHREGFHFDSVRAANDLEDTRIKDALRNASHALQNSQIYTANYVLTGRAESLKACRESLEDWQYESETLKLLSAGDRRAVLLRDFSQSGDRVAAEMAAVVALYDAGTHGAALDRLRTGEAMAYWDKIERMRDADLKAFSRVAGRRFYNALEVSGRLMFSVVGVYVLGFLACGLLLYFLRTAGSGSGFDVSRS